MMLGSVAQRWGLRDYDVDGTFLRSCWEIVTGTGTLAPEAPVVSALGDVKGNLPQSYRVTKVCTGEFALADMGLE